MSFDFSLYKIENQYGYCTSKYPLPVLEKFNLRNSIFGCTCIVQGTTYNVTGTGVLVLVQRIKTKQNKQVYIDL